jgi:hypothetical protein
MKVRLTLLAIVYIASSIATEAQTNEGHSSKGSPINANQVASAKHKGGTQPESRTQVTGTRTASPSIAGSTKARIAENYGKLPMRFEANQGQTDPKVKFLVRGRGYRLFLTGNEALMALKKPLTISPSATPPANRAVSSSVRMRLSGANTNATVVGVDKLTGQSNYFVGNDPTQWRTQVPGYASVRYERIYPGIDLIYHGNQSQLEYDFVADPGADVSVITMEVTVTSAERGMERHAA